MPRNTSVSLGEHFTGFKSARVEAGRYGSASDVVRAGLRFLEEHEARVRTMQAVLDEEEALGTPEPLDMAVFIAELRAGRAG